MRGLTCSFHRSDVNSLYASAFSVGSLGTNPHIAATRRTRTAVILNSSETSEPVGHLKYTIAVYIKSFGGQKGGLERTPRTPPAYGQVNKSSTQKNVWGCVQYILETGELHWTDYTQQKCTWLGYTMTIIDLRTTVCKCVQNSKVFDQFI